jgi:hypothetical protein
VRAARWCRLRFSGGHEQSTRAQPGVNLSNCAPQVLAAVTIARVGDVRLVWKDCDQLQIDRGFTRSSHPEPAGK